MSPAGLAKMATIKQGEALEGMSNATPVSSLDDGSLLILVGQGHQSPYVLNKAGELSTVYSHYSDQLHPLRGNHG